MKIAENIKNLRTKKIEALTHELYDKKHEYAMASLKVKAGKLDDISSVSKLKKDIARIKTIISEKNGVENE